MHLSPDGVGLSDLQRTECARWAQAAELKEPEAEQEEIEARFASVVRFGIKAVRTADVYGVRCLVWGSFCVSAVERFPADARLPPPTNKVMSGIPLQSGFHARKSKGP